MAVLKGPTRSEKAFDAVVSDLLLILLLFRVIGFPTLLLLSASPSNAANRSIALFMNGIVVDCCFALITDGEVTIPYGSKVTAVVLGIGCRSGLILVMLLEILLCCEIRSDE